MSREAAGIGREDVSDHKPAGPSLHDVETCARRLLNARNVMRTYPEGSETTHKELDGLFAAMTPVLPLRLDLEPTHFCWNEQAVLPSDERQQALPSDLYRDGVRRICVEPGIDREEAARLVSALSTVIHPDDTSEDYVTLLWEAHLPSVQVSAIDPYLDLGLPETILEGKERPGLEPGESSGAERQRELPPPPPDAFEVRPKDRVRLQREIESDATESPWKRLVESIFDVLVEMPTESRLSQASDVLEGLLAHLVAAGEVEVAARLITGLREKLPAGVAARMAPAVDALAGPGSVHALGVAIESGVLDAAAAEQLIELMGPLAAEGICGLIDSGVGEMAARIYANGLVRIGEPVVPVLLRHFTEAPPATRLVLARILGRLGDASAVPTLVEALRSGDALLKRELIRTLGMLHDERAVGRLMQIGLDDADETSRILALQGLGEARERIDPSRLLARVKSRSFESTSDEEKDLMFRVLGASHDARVVDYLAACLDPSWLALRGDPGLWRRAAEALSRVGTPEALEILQKGRQHRRGALARACEGALRRRHGDSR